MLRNATLVALLLFYISLGAQVTASTNHSAYKRIDDVKNQVVNFYSAAVNSPSQDEIQLNSSFSSGQISTHRLDYDPQLKAIIMQEEIGNNQAPRQIRLNYKGFSYLTETYNDDGEMIYCKTAVPSNHDRATGLRG